MRSCRPPKEIAPGLVSDTASAEELRAEQERIAAARRQRVGQLAQLDDEVRDAPAAEFSADPATPIRPCRCCCRSGWKRDSAMMALRLGFGFIPTMSISTLDRGLTEDERAAGKAWTAVWRATEEEAGTAWRTLVTRRQAARAMGRARFAPNQSRVARPSRAGI
jgi:hypothetical protein